MYDLLLMLHILLNIVGWMFLYASPIMLVAVVIRLVNDYFVRRRKVVYESTGIPISLFGNIKKKLFWYVIVLYISIMIYPFASIFIINVLSSH